MTAQSADHHLDRVATRCAFRIRRCGSGRTPTSTRRSVSSRPRPVAGVNAAAGGDVAEPAARRHERRQSGRGWRAGRDAHRRRLRQRGRQQAAAIARRGRRAAAWPGWSGWSGRPGSARRGQNRGNRNARRCRVDGGFGGQGGGMSNMTPEQRAQIDGTVPRQRQRRGAGRMRRTSKAAADVARAAAVGRAAGRQRAAGEGRRHAARRGQDRRALPAGAQANRAGLRVDRGMRPDKKLTSSRVHPRHHRRSVQRTGLGRPQGRPAGRDQRHPAAAARERRQQQHLRAAAGRGGPGGLQPGGFGGGPAAAVPAAVAAAAAVVAADAAARRLTGST